MDEKETLASPSVFTDAFDAQGEEEREEDSLIAHRDNNSSFMPEEDSEEEVVSEEKPPAGEIIGNRPEATPKVETKEEAPTAQKTLPPLVTAMASDERLPPPENADEPSDSKMKIMPIVSLKF